MSRESFYFYNNLTGLTKAIEGKYTTIDLRNESCVTGKVVAVDGFMNITLEDAIFYDFHGREIPLESFFVRARVVRYVHIPLDINIIDTVKKIGQRKPPKKVRTFKMSRAEQYHRETLIELAKVQKNREAKQE